MILLFWACQPCFEEDACLISMGQYHVVSPNSHPDRIWVFFHGWSGNPYQYIGKSYIDDVLAKQNVMLVLPKGKGDTWSMENMGGENSHRDEARFMMEIFDHLYQTRGGEDLPIYMGGFSLGGALSEHLACSGSLNLAGVHPISGGFWDPVPESCASGFDVRHVHGLSDTTWPFEGRRVGSGTQAHQEDIQALWKRTSSCRDDVKETIDGPLSCLEYTGCEHQVSWCTHSQGHTRLSGWFSRMVSSMKP